MVLFWRWYPKVAIFYALTLIVSCGTVQTLAYRGWFCDQPFLYLTAALIAFIAGVPCFLRMAKGLEGETNRTFGWQVRLVIHETSWLPLFLYVGSIAYVGAIIYVGMPSRSWGSQEFRNVLFPTGLTMFMACGLLMTCSAFLRSHQRQEGSG